MPFEDSKEHWCSNILVSGKWPKFARSVYYVTLTLDAVNQWPDCKIDRKKRGFFHLEMMKALTYTSSGYHLAECRHVPLGQVPFRKIVRALDQVPHSHLIKCSNPLG